MAQLFIKNMVCNRCIMVVAQLLDKLSIPSKDIELGEVLLENPLSQDKKKKLQQELGTLGFELIDDKNSQLIEAIKRLIIELVHDKDEDISVNLSTMLSQNLHHDYQFLSSLFSQVEGTTIEQYHIAQKIERVKELLVYDELSLSEIAHKLNYSSVAYLSNQFKKVTGLTPTHFKKIKDQKRKPLDAV